MDAAPVMEAHDYMLSQFLRFVHDASAAVHAIPDANNFTISVAPGAMKWIQNPSFTYFPLAEQEAGLWRLANGDSSSNNYAYALNSRLRAAAQFAPRKGPARDRPPQARAPGAGRMRLPCAMAPPASPSPAPRRHIGVGRPRGAL